MRVKAQAMFEYLLALSVLAGISGAIVITLYPALFPPAQYMDEVILCNQIANLLDNAANNVTSQISIGLPFNANITISNGNVIIGSFPFFVSCRAFSSSNETINGSILVAYLYKGLPRIAFIVESGASSTIAPTIVSWYRFPGNVTAYITGIGYNQTIGNLYGNYSLSVEGYLSNAPAGNYILHLVNNTYIKGQVLIIKT
jgi:hypothetical protein